VNRARAVDGFKKFLQVFDVCMIAVDGNTTCSTDKRKIPVLITQIVPYTSPATKITTYRYKCLTKVGFLSKTQDRSVLDYKPNLTGNLMGMDVASTDVSVRLSVYEASRQLNRLGGSNTCRCTTDWSKSSTFSCGRAKVMCSTTCHNGRGGNIYCQLC
jgi:hypothetical protein